MINDWHVLGVTQQTDNPFLNMYAARVDYAGYEFDYYFCSRRGKENISLITGNHTFGDAVVGVPIYKKNDEKYLVFIKQFRIPINDYVYEFPAGLVDPGETDEISVAREIKEETGGVVKKLRRIVKPSYSTVGISDETVSVYVAYIDHFEHKRVEASEDIEVEMVKFKEAKQFIATHNVDVKTSLLTLLVI